MWHCRKLFFFLKPWMLIANYYALISLPASWISMASMSFLATTGSLTFTKIPFLSPLFAATLMSRWQLQLTSSTWTLGWRSWSWYRAECQLKWTPGECMRVQIKIPPTVILHSLYSSWHWLCACPSYFFYKYPCYWGVIDSSSGNWFEWIFPPGRSSWDTWNGKCE